jgi:subtilisin family serine protease
MGALAMSKFVTLLRTSAAGAGLLLAAFCSPALAQAPGDLIPNQYICVFKPGPISAGAQARSAVFGVGGQVTHVYEHVFQGFAASMSATAAAKLPQKNPYIDYCEQDRIAGLPEPSETSSFGARKPGGGGGGGGSTQSIPWGVARVGGAGDGTGKTAWVIDSGVDLTHPDLNVDAASSLSFLTTDSSPNDANGHGTHVAGIIAAKNNTIGVVGIAAGARVVALRVLDATGNGPDSGVIAAIDYVAAHGQAGDVANLSLITTPMQAMDDAVVALGQTGVYVTIAAGNNSGNAGNYSPARANGFNVFTVSAFAQGDKFAFYSNHGNPPIDFGEPGSAIQSTYKNGGYTTLTGTSMAAPHLAGILLLTGVARSGGAVSGDPDGTPDTIGVR